MYIPYITWHILWLFCACSSFYTCGVIFKCWPDNHQKGVHYLLLYPSDWKKHSWFETLFMFLLLLVTYLDTGSVTPALCACLYLEKGKQPAALSWPDKGVRPIKRRISQPKWCARISSSNIPLKSTLKHSALYLIGIVNLFNNVLFRPKPSFSTCWPVCSTLPSCWSTSSTWPSQTFLHGSERRWLNWIISAGRPLR